MDSIARKQFRKTELYPFMVGQRFTTTDYIEACRDRYLSNKGVHLQIVQLSGTDIKVQCSSWPVCRFNFCLEYEDDIACWVVQEPYPVSEMHSHSCGGSAKQAAVVVPSTPPPPGDAVDLVSPDVHVYEAPAPLRKRRVSSDRRVCEAGYTRPPTARACKTKGKK